jgi:branched-chain amino acid transport system ATP-binding protein
VSSSDGYVPPASAAPVLELSDITAGYGRTTVLRGVNMSVPVGSVVALLGPNGAGKTTMLRVAAGLLSPSLGTVSIDGEDVTLTAPSIRAYLGICLVPGGTGIFPNLSVRENLRLQVPRWKQKGGFDKALEVFPVLGERLRQPAGTLSGGQQQMLALTRCFLADPKIVLVDEVSTGLAPLVIDELYRALLKLTERGVSLLLVEQYVGRALDVADRAYFLSRDGITSGATPGRLDSDDLIRHYFGG